MDLTNLKNLISLNESETLEFKKSTALLNKSGETLCGFLNNKGGKVIIGVNANGKLIGQHVSDTTLQELANLIHKFEPRPVIEIDYVPFEKDKKIILLSAFPRKFDVPYVFEGRPYQRVESTTSIMPQQIYQLLLLERNHRMYRWEIEATDYAIEDLDKEEILKSLRLGIEAGRLPEYHDENIPLILDRLEVRKNGQLLNAAIVLFGKKFLPQFAQCQLRLARFKGNDKSEFIDQKQIYGNAFLLLEEAILFLRRHLPIAGKIIPGILERKDELLFPIEALREALVNALCHRTYTNPGGAVSVAIFDDRLEIWNDGGLPFGLRSEELKKEHMSHPRNPLIATIFYYRSLIEKWGRGTQKIVSLCTQAGHPEPEFYEQAQSLVVRFLPRDYIHPTEISLKLTERQKRILQYLANIGGLSFSDIKSRLSNPPADKTLRDDLQHLKSLNLIHVRGFGRSARWYLNKAD